MVSRLEFATRDPERALPVLGEFFPDVRMSNPRGNFAFEMSTAQADSFSMVHYHLLSPNSTSSVDMTGTLTVASVGAGEVDLTAGRRVIDTSQPWIFPQQPVVGEWDEVTITAIALSLPDILRFARANLGDDKFRLLFTGNSPLDAARGRQWAALIGYTRQALSEEGPLMLSDIVRSNAFGHLASMLLATFPSTFMDAAERRSRASLVPSAVRRAAHFMDENAQLPITIEDIAREARMSIRGIQYAFRSTMGTTPTAYLRRVRMDGAHRSLQRGDPTRGDTVSSIATAWGFQHPGRFAKEYRECYGTTPRRTLES